VQIQCGPATVISICSIYYKPGYLTTSLEHLPTEDRNVGMIKTALFYHAYRI